MLTVASDILAMCRHSDCQQLKQDLAEAKERICVADAEARQVFVLDCMGNCFTDVHSHHTARCIGFWLDSIGISVGHQHCTQVIYLSYWHQTYQEPTAASSFTCIVVVTDSVSAYQQKTGHHVLRLEQHHEHHRYSVQCHTVLQ